mgnify:CR=1 FL=1
MPVLRIRGDADGLPGLELLWLLSLDLVVAATADRDEYLRRVVMDVPVVAQPGSKVTLWMAICGVSSTGAR